MNAAAGAASQGLAAAGAAANAAVESEQGQKLIAKANEGVAAASSAMDAAAQKALETEAGQKAMAAANKASVKTTESLDRELRKRGMTPDQLSKKFEGDLEKLVASTGGDASDERMAGFVDSALELGVLGPNAPAVLKTAAVNFGKKNLKKAEESGNAS